MKRYLKGFFNLIVKSVILFMGCTFALNVMVFGFLFLPDLMTKIDKYLILNQTWWSNFVPGMLPLFFILTIIMFAAFLAYKTVKFAQIIDIENVINEITGGRRKENE